MIEGKAPIKVEISYKTVVFTVGFLIALWLIIQIRDVIVLLFLALILLSALSKPVDWLNSRRVPRLLSVIIVYVILILVISLVFSIIIPPLVLQTTEFVIRIPQIVSTINDFLLFHNIPVENFSAMLSHQAQLLTGDIVSITKTIFSSILILITLFILTFYSLLEWRKFLRFVASPFSGKQEKRIVTTVTKVEEGIGKWVRGQLTLSLTVGVLTFIGLVVLNIPFALPLALIAGMLEIVPIVGPILAAIPAILVGLTVSPVMALAVTALFVIVQQLENHLIVPLVMSRVVGLQPPVVIIALLTGAKLAGVGGAFLAIPLIVVFKIIFVELLQEEKKIEGELVD